MSIKELVEQAMPGWAIENPSATAHDSVGPPPSDFVGKDIETIKRRYGATGAVAASADADAIGESGIVRMRSTREQDDPVLGTRAVVVVNGRASGVQG